MPQGHKNEHVKLYEQHNQRVRKYFKDRPNDFLEICWETGDGWKEICNFFEVPVPDKSLPHLNKAPNPLVTVLAEAKKALQKILGQN